MRFPWQQDNRALREQQRKADAAYLRVVETIATQTAQDLADEDATWRKIGQADAAEDLSAYDLAEARRKCLSAWTMDPGLARTASLLQSGTFGQGLITPDAVDARVQEVVDRFWEDPDNDLYLTGRLAQALANLKCLLYGEVFWVVYVSAADSVVKIGEVPACEITEVVTHPDKARQPVLYQRQFRPEEFDFSSGTYRAATGTTTWYYRDWRYIDADDDIPDGLASPPGLQDAYIYHLKVNSLGKRGVPEFYRAYDWTRAHHRSLSDLATWTKAAAMFAWKLKMATKSQAAIESAAEMFREPVPGTGAVHVGNQGVDLAAIDQPTGGGNLAATVREMHLEAIRPFPFGEHYYGNVSTGNLATAASMELPTIWGIGDRQELFRQVYLDLIGVAVDRAAKQQDFPTKRLPQSVDRSVSIDFPPVQPEAALPRAQAITTLAPLIDAKEAATQAYYALGITDAQDALERQFPQEKKLEGDTAQADTGDAVDTTMLQAQTDTGADTGAPAQVAEASTSADVMRPFPSGDPAQA